MWLHNAAAFYICLYYIYYNTDDHCCADAAAGCAQLLQICRIQFPGLQDGDSIHTWIGLETLLFEIIGMFYINFCIYKAACLSLSEWVICCLLTHPPQSCEKLKPFRQQISRSKCPPIYQLFKVPIVECINFHQILKNFL